MNYPSYGYNEQGAIKADTPLNQRITETGAYCVTIIAAEAKLSKEHTYGIEFSVETDEGATARYLSLYTLKADGARLFGHDILDSMLICAGLKSGQALKPGQATIKKYDMDSKREYDASAECYPGLHGKRIGLVLQKELSTYNGKDREKMIIVGAFDPETRKTATEKLTNAPAEQLDARLATLKDKDKRSAYHVPATTQGYSNQATNVLDDDIPF